MKRSKLIAGALALLPAAGVLAITQLADAHYPDLKADVVCVDTNARVTITAWSWITDDVLHRHNENIAIFLDNVQVGSGKFLPSNGHQFTVTLTRPAAGTTHTVTAQAIAPFGANGEFGYDGTFRETQITLPTSCVPTTTAAPTTTKAAPTTTAAPAATTSTTTTTEPAPLVLGTSVTRPDVAVAVEVLPRFAG